MRQKRRKREGKVDKENEKDEIQRGKNERGKQRDLRTRETKARERLSAFVRGHRIREMGEGEKRE